jgi:murein L,D-transpeptidase YcbB/YkuD
MFLERLSAIRANIPIAEYSKDLGDRYVVVNIPAQQIETVNGNRVFSRHNAIRAAVG